MFNSSARNANRFGFSIKTFSCGEDKFKLGFQILGKAQYNKYKELIACELVEENTTGYSHIAIVVGIRRYKCYLKWSCFRILLKDFMSGSNAYIGSSEDNNVLYGQRL